MTSLQHIVLVFSPIFSTSNGFLFGAGSGQKMGFDGYAPRRRHSKAADSMIPIYERSEVFKNADMYDPAGRTRRGKQFFDYGEPIDVPSLKRAGRRWRLDNSLNNDFEPEAADYASEAEKEELSLLQRKFKSQLKFVNNYLDVKNEEVDDDDTDLFSPKNIKKVRNPMSRSSRQFG